jgi:hypothetical protein
MKNTLNVINFVILQQFISRNNILENFLMKVV